MDDIRRIDRKLIRKGHVFDYYEDTMQSSTGHIAYWDFLKHNGAASIVPVTDDGKILLVRQFRNAVDRMTWEIPAGKKDTPEEAGYDCAKRELEEETGYYSDNIEPLIKLVTAIAYCSETIDIFTAKNLKPSKQNLDEDEFIDVKAFTIDELKQMIFDQTIQDSKTVAAIMAYIVKEGL